MILHSNQLHLTAVSEGEAVVTNQNAWLCIERIFGIAGNAIEFIETVMCWPIQYWLRKVDIFKEEIFGGLTVSVIKRHAYVVFTDASGVITV